MSSRVVPLQLQSILFSVVFTHSKTERPQPMWGELGLTSRALGSQWKRCWGIGLALGPLGPLGPLGLFGFWDLQSEPFDRISFQAPSGPGPRSLRIHVCVIAQSPKVGRSECSARRERTVAKKTPSGALG